MSSLAGVRYPSAEGLECPYPYYEWLRTESAVHQLPDRPNVFLVSDHEAIRRVMRDHKTFSSVQSRRGMTTFDLLLGGPSDQPVSTVLEADPPEHKPKRELIRAPLRPARVTAYAGWMREYVDGLIDGFAPAGRVEFVSEFANRLPVLVTCRLLGIPDEDRPLVSKWSRFEGVGLSWMPDDFQRGQQRTAAEMNDYLTGLLERRHAAPADDVTSEMIRAQVARDGTFDLPEVRAQLSAVLAGGVLTTSHFLSSAMLLLLQHPDQLERVRADHALIPRMIEEALRLEAPAQWIPRRVAVDTTLEGVELPAGSFVLLMLASGSRDEAAFKCPAHFDIGRRDAHAHLNFGYGVHFCVGAPLARLETRIAFERLLTRLRDLRAAPNNDFTHSPSPSFRGLRRLELEFTPE